MTVPDPNKPQLSITPQEINFGNKDITSILTIKNSGNGILQWSLKGNQSWIGVDLNSGSLTSGKSVDVNVSADRKGLSPNNYSGFINVTSTNGGAETCNIQMEIPAAPILAYDPAVLDFSYNKESMVFTIKNNGTGNLNWSLKKNKDWINLSETSGTNQSSINVSVDRNKLQNGSFSGQVEISSEGAGTANIIINVEKRDPNTPPKLDFALSPPSGFLETNFLLTVSCSDDYTTTDNLLVRWKWQDEDQFSSWSTSKSSSHTFSTAGTKNITVEVKDKDEVITTSTKSVVVSKNEKPVALFTVIPAEIMINSEFMVDASESFDDFTSKANLQVRWKLEVNGGFSDWTTIKTAKHMYTSAAGSTITLEVKDEAGMVSSTTKNVMIEESDREPNDSKVQSQTISLNSKINGAIGFYNNKNDYYDYLNFTPAENGNITLSFKNQAPGYYNGGCYLYAPGFDANVFDSDIDYMTAIRGMDSGIKENSETIPISKGSKYHVRIKYNPFQDGIPYEFSTSFVPNSVSDSGEPNDNAAMATAISLNTTITALIGYSSDDDDYYLIMPTIDGNFTFTLKNLQPSGITSGSIESCSLIKFGEVNSLSSISNISVATSKSSTTIGVSKNVKYVIKVSKGSRFESAPYELKTTFQ